MDNRQLAETIAKILYNKKGENIVVLDVRNKTTITDYMVIASGNTFSQVRALMDNLEDELAKENIFPLRKEGMNEARWGVIDFNYVMVHIFNNHDRDIYKLDALWFDDNRLEVDINE